MMRKNPPARSQAPDSSTMLLDRLFGKGATKSLALILARSPAEKALAASKTRVRVLQRQLEVAKKTARAVSRVRRKRAAIAELEALALAGQLTDVSADRDLLLTANTDLIAKVEGLELSVCDQQRMHRNAEEANSIIVKCAQALTMADPASFKRIFSSPGTSASRILVTSITKVINPRPLPGGKSKSGRV